MCLEVHYSAAIAPADAVLLGRERMLLLRNPSTASQAARMVLTRAGYPQTGDPTCVCGQRLDLTSPAQRSAS